MSKSAPAGPLQQLSDALADVVVQAAQSVVAVHSARSRSSGFIWRPGLIVTADEALAEEGDISVALPDGEAAAATLVGRDPTTDVALLRVDRVNAPAAPLQSASIGVGALVTAVGRHNGAPIAAFGVVSWVGGAWRSLRGGDIDAKIELDLSRVAPARAASRSTPRAALLAWLCLGRDDGRLSFLRPPSTASPQNCRPTAGSPAATLGSGSNQPSWTAMADSGPW